MTNDNANGVAAAAGTAKDEAAGMAHAAADSGQDLLHEVKDEAGEVLAEAGDQARGLLDEATTGLRAQASEQQVRAAAGLRALGDELGRMADGSQDAGLATDLVRQAAGRSSSVATWLEEREPGDVLHDVTDFAQRRPGLFIALAAGAGVLAGRVARGLKDAPPTPRPSAGAAEPAGADEGSAPEHREPAVAPVEPPARPAVPSEEAAWAASGSRVPSPAHPRPVPTPGGAGGDPLAGALGRDRR